jgi:hypothetical protein
MLRLSRAGPRDLTDGHTRVSLQPESQQRKSASTVTRTRMTSARTLQGGNRSYERCS